MTSVNKVIILCAKVFAAFIVAGIICSVLSFVAPFADGGDDEFSNFSEVYLLEVDNIDIELSAAELTVVAGKGFKVETNDERAFDIESSSNMKIKEKNIWGKKNNLKVVLTVPSDAALKSFSLDAGAGDLSIGKITAESFYLEVGAGNVEIDELNAKAEIQGGVGNIVINGGAIRDLDLELGVGDVDITAELMGKSEVECGIGDLDLVLEGGEENYRIACDVGLGNFKISGDKVKGSRVIGNGVNSVDIDGGIGDVSVAFVVYPIID